VEVQRRKGRPPLVRLVPWAPRLSDSGAGGEGGADAAG
jgi:hypothetical protein